MGSDVSDGVTMRIGEVAERTGLSFRTLRHYDDIGLVAPSARTEGGFRLYTSADVARLLLIRRMKPLGYALDEMRELLDVVDALADDPRDERLRAVVETFTAEAQTRRERLSRQVEMADEFLAQLGELRFDVGAGDHSSDAEPRGEGGDDPEGSENEQCDHGNSPSSSGGA